MIRIPGTRVGSVLDAVISGRNRRLETQVASPTVGPRPSTNWKRLALISLFGGFGFAMGLVAVLGAIVWYNGRPKPPKPWSTSAIVANGAPRFSALNGEKKGVELTYAVANRTESDYRIESNSPVSILIRTKDGVLSPPFSDGSLTVTNPVFVPSGQKGSLALSVLLPDVPESKTGESDVQYHERLRDYLEHHAEAVASFVIFDDSNKYEIDLPRWLPQKPKEE